MDVNQIISRPLAHEEYFANEALRIINTLYLAIEYDFGSHIIKDIKSDIEKIASEWSKTKEVKYGYQPKSFYIDRAYGFRFLLRMNDFYDTKFRYNTMGYSKKGYITTTDFTVDLFSKMVSVQAAFHLGKFGEIKLHELTLASIEILFKYFVLMKERDDGFDDYRWCFTADDIRKVINNIGMIIRNDANFFKYVKMPLELPGEIKKEDNRRPRCAEDYLRFYQEGMNVNEWKSVLMKEWDQSEKTVRNYFKRFRIEPTKITKPMSLKDENDYLREIIKRNNIEL